jgi:quercetin dioxygenase-like cupin family protein
MTNKRETMGAEEVLPPDLIDVLARSLAPLPLPRPEALKASVLARVRESADYVTVRTTEGRWEAITPLVERKLLHADGYADSYYLRLAPGGRLPAHVHAADELCVVLEGTVRLGGVEVGPGDFHLARAGSGHGVVESPRGALLFIRTARATHAPAQ